MTRQQLANKLSVLYGLPCVYEDGGFTIKGPKGHDLLRIGDTGNAENCSLFGIGVANGACQTFHTVERSEA